MTGAGHKAGYQLDACKRHCHCIDVQRVLACSFVRICDEGDEAVQPEWEIDPKDLQLMEKVHSPSTPAACILWIGVCMNPA